MDRPLGACRFWDQVILVSSKCETDRHNSRYPSNSLINLANFIGCRLAIATLVLTALFALPNKAQSEVPEHRAIKDSIGNFDYRVLLLEIDNNPTGNLTDLYEKTLDQIGVGTVRPGLKLSDRPNVRQLLEKHDADIAIIGFYEARDFLVRTRFYGKPNKKAALKFPTGYFNVPLLNGNESVSPILFANLASAIVNKMDANFEDWLMAMRLHYMSIKELDPCQPKLSALDQIAFAGTIIWPEQAKCSPVVLRTVNESILAILEKRENISSTPVKRTIFRDLTDNLFTLLFRARVDVPLKPLRQLSRLDLNEYGDKERVLPIALSAAYIVAQSTNDVEDLAHARDLLENADELTFAVGNDLDLLRFSMLSHNINRLLEANDMQVVLSDALDTKEVENSLSGIGIPAYENLALLTEFNSYMDEICAVSKEDVQDLRTALESNSMRAAAYRLSAAHNRCDY